MDFLIGLANGLTGLVGAGAENLMGLITGIIPNVLILLTLVNTIVAAIGEERVNNAMKFLTGNPITRYTILPFLAGFFFTNPMCYSAGRFLEEQYKGAFIDATFTILHPMTGIFPHCNPGELFIWMGIAQGVLDAGKSTGSLAVVYLITGFIMAFVRGIVNEFIYKAMDK